MPRWQARCYGSAARNRIGSTCRNEDLPEIPPSRRCLAPASVLVPERPTTGSGSATTRLGLVRATSKAAGGALLISTPILWWGWFTWPGNIDLTPNLLYSSLPVLASVPAFWLGNRRQQLSRLAILGVGLLTVVAFVSALAAAAMIANHFGWDHSWYGPADAFRIDPHYQAHR